jgi:predicted amidohydrolase
MSEQTQRQLSSPNSPGDGERGQLMNNAQRRDLIALVEGCDTTFEACAALLRHLRRRSDEYGLERHNMRNPARTREAMLAAVKLFDAGSLETVPKGIGEELSKWVDDFSNLLPLVRVRCLAEAIDTACGTSFLKQAKSYYTEANTSGSLLGRQILEDEPIPVASGLIDLLRRSGVDVTTDPYNLPSGQHGDRTRRLVLAPASVEQLTVRLDFSLAREIEQFAETETDLKVAVCLPTFDWNRHYEASWEWGSETFFWTKPKTASHQTRLRKCLEAAAGAGASIAVFPELSGTDEMHIELREAWLKLPAEQRPRILAVGSCHRETEDNERLNVARLAVHNDRAGDDAGDFSTGFFDAHRKAVPYVERRPPPAPRGKKQPATMAEDITHDPQPELRIFAGQQSMLFGLVICIDFLDGRVRDVLRDLCIDLILLPAMSRKTRVFEDLMAGHVAATQATVILANAIIGEFDTHALVSRPHGERRVTRIDADWKSSHQDGDTPKRGKPGVAVVALSNPRHSQSRWIPV